MATKIERMTPEQEAALPVFREQWRAEALRTDRINEDEARVAINNLYTASGLNPPRWIIFAQSPMQALLMRGVFRMGDGDQLWDQLRDQLRDQLGGQLHSGGLWQGLFFVGAWDAFWIANYDYARKIGMRLEPGLNARLDAYIQYARTCGAAFLYPEIAIVCDRPTGLSFDAEHRLHCENGPAIAYADGYSIYAWRGVRIPEEWVTQGPPDAQTLLRWENMEQRTVAGDVMGWDKLIEPLPQTVIDKDDDPVIGELIQVDDMPDTDGPEFYLKARCGTGRVICMNVTPSVVEEGCRTALEAGASTYRLPPDLYRAGSANRT